MTLEIISPSEILFKGEAQSVTLPGVLGSFTVLKNHASLISVLKKGEVFYRTPEGTENSVDKKAVLQMSTTMLCRCVCIDGDE